MSNAINRPQGFTLIELVVVIVLLGILAITAAPKFIDVTTDAKIATLEGMKAAMVSGTQLTYSKAYIQGKTIDDDTVETGNVSIQIHSGYPVGNWGLAVRYIVDLDSSVNLQEPDDICGDDWCGRGNAKSSPGGASTITGRITKAIPRGHSWNDQCGVFYINHENGSEPEFGIESAEC